jgi:hypothetical protein
LGAVLALVKQQQAAYPPHQRRHHPARQRPPNNLEAPGMPSKSRLSRREAAAALAGQPVLEPDWRRSRDRSGASTRRIHRFAESKL